MRPDPQYQPPIPPDGAQDDPDYIPPPPDLDVNDIRREELDLDTYTDEDFKGAVEP